MEAEKKQREEMEARVERLVLHLWCFDLALKLDMSSCALQSIHKVGNFECIH